MIDLSVNEESVYAVSREKQQAGFTVGIRIGAHDHCPVHASFRRNVYNETTQDVWNKQAAIELEARMDD